MGPAFAVHPGSSLTSVDYAAVLEAVAPPHGFAHDPATYRPHDDGYDVVVRADVLHTVPPDTAPCWLADLASAVRPGGVLVIVDPLVNAQRYVDMLVIVNATGVHKWTDLKALGVPC